MSFREMMRYCRDIWIGMIAGVIVTICVHNAYEAKKLVNMTNAIQVVEVNEPNDSVWIEVASIETAHNISIACENDSEVLIDVSGDEVKVTGASEEGARVFFVELLKPIIDEYLASKRQGD